MSQGTATNEPASETRMKCDNNIDPSSDPLAMIVEPDQISAIVNEPDDLTESVPLNILSNVKANNKSTNSSVISSPTIVPCTATSSDSFVGESCINTVSTSDKPVVFSWNLSQFASEQDSADNLTPWDLSMVKQEQSDTDEEELQYDSGMELASKTTPMFTSKPSPRYSNTSYWASSDHCVVGKSALKIESHPTSSRHIYSQGLDVSERSRALHHCHDAEYIFVKESQSFVHSTLLAPDVQVHEHVMSRDKRLWSPPKFPMPSTTRQAAAPVATVTSSQCPVNQEVQGDSTTESKGLNIGTKPPLAVTPLVALGQPDWPTPNHTLPYESINFIIKQEPDISDDAPAAGVTGSFTCFACRKKFSTEFLLSKHYQTDFADQPCQLSCRHCLKTFPFDYLLLSHLKMHTDAFAYSCPKCSLHFNHFDSYKRHIKACGLEKKRKPKTAGRPGLTVNTRIKSYHCAQCRLTFKQRYRFKAHVESHSNATPFPNSVCNRDFNGETGLTHMRIYEQPYICKTCGESFQWKYRLKEHIRTHSVAVLFPCTVCGRVFKKETTLQRHMRVHKKPYICTTCGETFKHKYGLKDHKFTHRRSNREFEVGVKLEARMQVQEKSYACNTCDAKFKYKNQYITHLQIHTNKNKYPCELCDKSFRLLKTLKYHYLVHSGLKAGYHCANCDMVFDRKTALAMHMIAHRDPFKCVDCDKTFKHRNSYLTHVQTHHTVRKSFKCGLCRKAFEHMQNLSEHMELHDSESACRCHICGESFGRHSKLASHVKTHRFF